MWELTCFLEPFVDELDLPPIHPWSTFMRSDSVQCESVLPINILYCFIATHTQFGKHPTNHTRK